MLWRLRRVTGQERQHAWGLAETPSGQWVGPYQTDISNEPVSKKSIRIIVNLFFMDTSLIRIQQVSDTYRYQIRIQHGICPYLGVLG